MSATDDNRPRVFSEFIGRDCHACGDQAYRKVAGLYWCNECYTALYGVGTNARKVDVGEFPVPSRNGDRT